MAFKDFLVTGKEYLFTYPKFLSNICDFFIHLFCKYGLYFLLNFMVDWIYFRQDQLICTILTENQQNNADIGQCLCKTNYIFSKDNTDSIGTMMPEMIFFLWFDLKVQNMYCLLWFEMFENIVW